MVKPDGLLRGSAVLSERLNCAAQAYGSVYFSSLAAVCINVFLSFFSVVFFCGLSIFFV